jgi:hypothetical protein
MLVNWQRDDNDGICSDFFFDICTLLRQCTYLGYLLLEAPREYVQYGPLVSIYWPWLCPQFGARVRSHAVRRRLFTVLMTAAHISPNVFSLRNFLSNTHVLFLAYVTVIHTYYTSHSNNIYILLLWDNYSIISSAPPGRPTALGLLCPIQLYLQNIGDVHFDFGKICCEIWKKILRNLVKFRLWKISWPPYNNMIYVLHKFCKQ